MKRKGFTLIELLAVIVVLAIIALIATPIIIRVIEKARKGAFEDTAYGVVDAAKIYYAGSFLESGTKGETFTFPEDTKLKLSGEKPKGGSVVLYEDGKIELAIHNEKWCATKGKEENKVTIKDYNAKECKLDTEVAGDPCFEVDNLNGSMITAYTCESKDVVIPSKIGGVNITAIGEKVFYEKQITSVVIPDGVTIIHNYAFMDNQLTSIELPDSVTMIGSDSFRSNKLTSVKMSSNIWAISSYSFVENPLTSIEIPSSISMIGAQAFASHTKIIINKPLNSIEGSPWGGASVEWSG